MNQSSLREADQRSWLRQWTYDLSRVSARLLGVATCQIRCGGRQHVPATGGGLICSNHQSFLDPILIGLACDRRLNYLARRTLFESPALGQLMSWYDAIPLEREGLGLGGMKETLKRLKRGELVLLFPEGTRTQTGEIGPVKPGFSILAQRSNVPLIPVTISGAFDVWPRNRHLPRPSPLWIQFAPPIPASEVQSQTEAQLIARLRASWDDCLAQTHLQVPAR
jgi:1-acyl-sn-glycerol-3-phosphate acyltransferase